MGQASRVLGAVLKRSESALGRSALESNHGAAEVAAVRDFDPANDRFGSKAERLTASKCFPLFP